MTGRDHQHDRAATPAQNAVLSLDALVARLADGERQLFTPVFELLWPRVLTFARTLLPDPDDAEDAAQRAMARLFEQINEYRAGSSAASWALAITAWECRSLRRRHGRAVAWLNKQQRAATSAGGAPLDATPPGADPEAEFALKEVLRAAEQVLGTLSDMDQQTLRAAWDDREHTGHVSGATFRKRYQRALERLRNRWRGVYGS